MIARLLLWRLDGEVSFGDLRERLDGLEPLQPPSTWLADEPAERFGVLLLGAEDDLATPGQVAEVRALLGREPDLYEEFDAWGPSP